MPKSIYCYCLADPIQNLGLLETFTFFFGGDNPLIHVASLAIDHNNAEIPIFVSEGVLIANNIRMP